MTDIQNMKTDHFYVVELDNRRTVVKAVVSDWDNHVHVYECGDEQGWRLPRNNMKVKVIREIRI